MKFLPLALSILLAAATQVHVLQADAPSQLEQARTALSPYLDELQKLKNEALMQTMLLDPVVLRNVLAKHLDSLQSLIPVDSQLNKAITDIRTKVDHDIEELRKELEPKGAELKAVLEKHVEDYRTRLEPMIQDYIRKHRENMDALKAKLEPIVEEMIPKVATNVEETKAVLVPMVESVRQKLTESLEKVRTMVAPYVEEYKEQVSTSMNELIERSGHKEDWVGGLALAEKYIEELKEKVGHVTEEARAKLVALYETVRKH